MKEEKRQMMLSILREFECWSLSRHADHGAESDCDRELVRSTHWFALAGDEKMPVMTLLAGPGRGPGISAVSYTHLTLPTSSEV